MEMLKKRDNEVFECVRQEIEREEYSLILIASENYVHEEVLSVQGSILTNKYAEGYPDRRYYGGCRFVDSIEKLAIERTCQLFGAAHANVQPHSGSSANMAVFFSMLKPGDKILGMNLAHGGHLTHGAKVNFSGKFFEIVAYGVSPETELIDYDEVRRIALKEQPKIIIAGASAYSRVLDFKRFREIADEAGAYLMVDIAHIAGAVATGVHPTPVGLAQFVTTTTHKTLRGPRGGLIMCDAEFAKPIDSMVFPGIQGGPLMHVIAAKAVALKNAMEPEFKVYQEQIVKNARRLAEALQQRGFRIVSGGTDNHLFLLYVASQGITGKEAEQALERSGIMVNTILIPFDTKGANTASGIRIGTPAVTTRGMKEPEMDMIAEFTDTVLRHKDDEGVQAKIRGQVRDLCAGFPFYAGMFSQ
jgi:glycine hydroxymethyltransferase